MSKRQPKSKFPFRVNPPTIEHGRTFVDRWFKEDVAIVADTCGVTVWPVAPDTWIGADSTPEQEAHQELIDSIVDRFHEIARDPIAELFVRAANDTLAIDESATADAQRMDAIRRLFLDPKERYTRDEVAVMMGEVRADMLFDSVTTTGEKTPRTDDHEHVAALAVEGLISPITIANALGESAPEHMQLVTVAVAMPRWCYDALTAAATSESGRSISDAIIETLRDAAGGMGASNAICREISSREPSISDIRVPETAEAKR